MQRKEYFIVSKKSGDRKWCCMGQDVVIITQKLQNISSCTGTIRNEESNPCICNRKINHQKLCNSNNRNEKHWRKINRSSETCETIYVWTNLCDGNPRSRDRRGRKVILINNGRKLPQLGVERRKGSSLLHIDSELQWDGISFRNTWPNDSQLKDRLPGSGRCCLWGK